ncbi:MAG: hydantoinase/oxoprolinase family protein [Betaproteobacteria bacterium]|nr:MAG: hydantoinase/oxoprolinase family protein [Betaproteobacteria bacterium]
MDTGFVVAVDVGGTCTDCVVFRPGEPLRIGKSLSTPPDFAHGVMDAVRSAALSMGLELEALLGETALFLHGSTVVDNALLTKEGAPTGLVTTAGFEDTLLMTRGAYGRWSGQPEEVIKHPVATDRPSPLVPRTRIFGVRERVDKNGEVLETLDEPSVEAAVGALLRQGVRAVAVCLLWSFRNPAHERRVREIIRRMDATVEVSISSEVAPVPGEYERSSTTVINAYAAGVTRAYLEELSKLLSRARYGGELLVMQGYGGLVPVAEAAKRPVGMIECGPAAGMIGARFLGDVLGDADIIAADMGGTTFKVGVISGGELDYAREPLVDRYHYIAAKLELVSIGAGGGSIVTIEPHTRRPKVGPRSAGSRPGPVCYGRGGAEPTLTDVAAIIGYMDPRTFLGGALPLDIEAARRVFEHKVARPLGMEVEEAAIGIYRIACAQLSDLVRSVTVERGLDPREFVLHAFGGSCGLFAGAFARELGIERVLIPFTASVNCAFGMVTADVVHNYAVVQPVAAPVAAESINGILQPMAEQALRQLAAEGFAPEAVRLKWAVDLRYRRQVHQVTTPLRLSGSAVSGLPVTEEAAQRLLNDFEQLYEMRYGRGSAFRAAGIELVTFRLTASGLMRRPDSRPEPSGSEDATAAQMGERAIFVESASGLRPARTYDFARLRPGNRVPGPAVVHSAITTLVVPAGQRAHMDGYRNLVLTAG